MLPLEALGNRICIIGCSSSGKSTLGDRLSKKLSIPVIHLDFLAHHHDSNWARKADAELVDEHRRILENDTWIIEGNYSVCMKERFEKATAIIWLDSNVLMAACRYIKRSLLSKSNRVGKLPGAKKEFDVSLLKHILFTYPKNKYKYQNIIKPFNIPMIKVQSMRELDSIYHCWRLNY